jgi:hypothetical protein
LKRISFSLQLTSQKRWKVFLLKLEYPPEIHRVPAKNSVEITYKMM